MAKTITRVWWRGYQALLDASSGRVRMARGTERIPHTTPQDDLAPRSLANIPRHRLEELAWRHASNAERTISDGAKCLPIRRTPTRSGADGEFDERPAETVIVPVVQLTDVELMLKIPTDVLARLAMK